VAPEGLANGKVAWVGKNALNVDIGVTVSRFRNPAPGKVIAKLTFRSGVAVWGIIAVTLSDAAVEPVEVAVALTYEGMRPDAEWRKQAEERIEKIRKADLKILVRDKRGVPVRDARVHVALTSGSSASARR